MVVSPKRSAGLRYRSQHIAFGKRGKDFFSKNRRCVTSGFRAGRVVRWRSARWPDGQVVRWSDGAWRVARGQMARGQMARGAGSAPAAWSDGRVVRWRFLVSGKSKRKELVPAWRGVRWRVARVPRRPRGQMARWPDGQVARGQVAKKARTVVKLRIAGGSRKKHERSSNGTLALRVRVPLTSPQKAIFNAHHPAKPVL